ncbi:hypothetical protein [Bradymonas sediminis]|uniref:Uncharacterized protein n=1 Tax=Bradymonas sediminis TaxID=1548548 RepID=A0A2Z4FK41_9DELT|nr:hypothetical protein [Bradymonas sediminis]AWV89044.1 hypothetical protein DN745_06705 [Bradymonas sediminis]TDP64496.1 hypothetical protein DFR33_109160 [Bradymonas sediminis]
MDKNTEQDTGRGADVQARQAEDGTFELVVSDSAAHAAVTEEAVKSHREAEAAPSEAVAPSPAGMKRAGVVLLLVALIGGGAVYLFASGDDEVSEPAQAARSGSDGFQPYAGGGGAAPTSARSNSQGETIDRLKAAEREEDPQDRFGDPRAQAANARERAAEQGAEQLDEDQAADDGAWELDEAALLEEARAVEMAEKAAAEETAESENVEDGVDDESVQEVEEPEPRGEILKERGVRIMQPKMSRESINRIQRVEALRISEKRPPLRGLRGLQRRAEQEAAQAEQGPEGEDGYWDEAETDDRVPEFGSD